jgi:acyl-CoA synthetase (AMP-forming)/AMP-acid ligase II
MHPLLADFAEIQAKAPERAPEPGAIDLDLACLIYTSGTTGESKGVMCDHASMVFVAETVARYLKNSERDVVVSVLPLAFSYGLYQLLAMVCCGGTLVLEESFAFPDLVMRKMAAEGATGFAAVPSIYARLLTMDLSGIDLSSLRYLTNAAAGLPVEQVKRVRILFRGRSFIGCTASPRRPGRWTCRRSRSTRGRARPAAPWKERSSGSRTRTAAGSARARWAS